MEVTLTIATQVGSFLTKASSTVLTAPSHHFGYHPSYRGAIQSVVKPPRAPHFTLSERREGGRLLFGKRTQNLTGMTKGVKIFAEKRKNNETTNERVHQSVAAHINTIN